jgi:epoxyqueuosine reductase
MSDDTRASAPDSACGPGGLADLCERVLSDFIADPARNNLGPGAPDPAWEGYLLGFAAGNDPLWEELKTAAGPEHWTPAEAFAAARDASTPAAGSPNSKQPTTPWAAASDAAASLAASEDLTVISWAVVQTEATKASNRLETRMPSEPWARARVFGQMANRELHHALLDALRAEGYEAIAPAMLASWGEVAQGTNDWHSAWSERHVAYVAGLGTFGLSGGLITCKGQAVRFGSVVVRSVIPATPRPYSSPFAYCLHFSGDGCAECAERCPVGSVSVQGRDKTACVGQLDRAESFVKQTYGFEGYGCGLCQTGVPCESGIPEGLSRPGS